MINIVKLDISRCLYAEFTDWITPFQLNCFKQVHPSENPNNDSVIMRQVHYTRGESYASDWMVKYNLRLKREIWSYKLDKKYKANISFDELINTHNTQNESDNMFDDYLCNIEYVNDNLYFDSYGTQLSLRNTQTGRVVAHNPYGSISSKYLVFSQDGYVLLWDKRGVLECFKNSVIKWKCNIPTRPDDSLYHPSVGFVLLYRNHPKLLICREKDGKVATKSTPVPSGAHCWCKTNDGIILASKSFIYHYDIRTAHHFTLVHFPHGHQFISMRQTNKNYLVILTKTNTSQHYLIYDIEARKILHTLDCIDPLKRMNAVGVGDNMVLMSWLEGKTLFMYDILHDKLRPLLNTSNCSMIQPYGRKRVLVNSNIAISIYG